MNETNYGSEIDSILWNNSFSLMTRKRKETGSHSSVSTAACGMKAVRVMGRSSVFLVKLPFPYTSAFQVWASRHVVLELAPNFEDLELKLFIYEMADTRRCSVTMVTAARASARMQWGVLKGQLTAGRRLDVSFHSILAFQSTIDWCLITGNENTHVTADNHPSSVLGVEP